MVYKTLPVEQVVRRAGMEGGREWVGWGRTGDRLREPVVHRNNESSISRVLL